MTEPLSPQLKAARAAARGAVAAALADQDITPQEKGYILGLLDDVDDIAEQTGECECPEEEEEG
mgnify:CR=1 FL=1